MKARMEKKKREKWFRNEEEKDWVHSQQTHEGVQEVEAAGRLRH